MNYKSLALMAAASVLAISAADAREVKVAGSSTVLPYAQIVAENFQKEYPNFTVTVEGGGSSAGLKQFCEGLGEGTIDVANASRQIKDKEVDACKAAGVTEIIENQFGYDGIVLAYSTKQFAADGGTGVLNLTAKDVYLMAAAQIGAAGQVVDNPYKTMKDVNDSLPAWPIKLWIPGEKHGTREVFEEKLLKEGCIAAGVLDALVETGMDKKDAEKECIKVRKDGLVVDIDGDYTETLNRLDQNKKSIGVFGLSFRENNKDVLSAATIEGIEATEASVATGEYPVSRPLFFYVKKQHLGVIPGLQEYVDYFLSEDMVGPGSPLNEYGLVPAPDSERDAVRDNFTSGNTL